MYDISLYGHLVFDTVYDNGEKTNSMGGIANVWKALGQINPKLTTYVCPTNIGTSSIIIDRDKTDRQSISFLNDTDVRVKIKKSKISHIAYLNEIRYPAFIEDIEGYVTADICNGRSIDISLYPMIKILFVSDEDLYLIKNLNKYTGILVRHSPKYSKLSTLDSIDFCSYTHNEYLENINVLGAGDYFAAKFLSNTLIGMINNKNLIDSHIKTTEYLKDRNDC